MIYTHFLNKEGHDLRSRSMDFEVIAEIFYADPYKRHDKTLQETQMADSERYIASVIAATTACYTD